MLLSQNEQSLPASPRNVLLLGRVVHPGPDRTAHSGGSGSGLVGLPVLGTLARHGPPLGLVEEAGDVVLVVRPGREAQPADLGRLELGPADVAPVAVWVLVRFPGPRGGDDLAAELVGAVDGALDGGPLLAEGEALAHDHVGGADEPEGFADVVAGVRGEEELEPFPVEVGVGEAEAVRVGGVDSRVGEEAPDALEVADEDLAPGALKGEVGEGLGGLVGGVAGGQVVVDPARVVVVLDVLALDVGFEGHALGVTVLARGGLEAGGDDEVDGVLGLDEVVELEGERLAEGLAPHVLGEVGEVLAVLLEGLDDEVVGGGGGAGVCGDAEGALGEGLGPAPDAELHGAQLDVVVVHHHVAEGSRAGPDHVGGEPLDGEGFIEPARGVPVRENVFHDELLLVFLFLDDARAVGKRGAVGQLTAVLGDGFGETDGGAGGGAGDALDDEMAKGAIGGSELRLLEGETALASSEAGGGGGGGPDELHLFAIEHVELALGGGVLVLLQEQIGHDVRVGLDAEKAVIEVEHDHLLEQRLIRELVRFSPWGCPSVRVGHGVEDLAVRGGVTDVDNTASLVLPVGVDDLVEASEDVFREVVAARGFELVDEGADAVDVGGEVLELDVGLVSMVPVAHDGHTDLCLLQKGAVDVLHDVLDLLLGGVNVGVHGAGGVDEE
ncbi:unnamed protein product [Clonostachys rhizophaga]|uniref:Uncharacterized protein n=1 Tax=Clonostachys rhizophaga TaxID=160324 RepID=A0A9N9VV51_9HYPO|nr:unnamed protein product [Clonostachys rhizophaga]